MDSNMKSPNPYPCTSPMKLPSNNDIAACVLKLFLSSHIGYLQVIVMVLPLCQNWWDQNSNIKSVLPDVAFALQKD